jgi:hypothetical protein
MLSTHFDIPKLKVSLRSEYLYDLKAESGKYSYAEIISVASYPGHVPTFTALVEDKFLFHYLPVNSFANKACPPMSLEQACYFNCPSNQLGVSVIGGLGECQVFDKNKDFIEGGKYLMTFDWYNENDLCHLVLLDTGHYVLVPSHKIIFGDSDVQLPNFKKLHATWKV